MNHSFEAIAAELETSDHYRVLRLLEPWTDHSQAPNELTFTGLIVDVETTGTDVTHDDVIELGMLKFEYGASGRIQGVIDTLSQLHQPSMPIRPEVTRLTGISAGDVAGRQIDDAAVQAFAADATLVIAHHASFDRPMCERRWPLFAQKDWACSCTQLPWQDEGHEGAKLSYLLTDHGYFHAGHRAITDCHAVLRLLALPLRSSGRMPLSILLESRQRCLVRLWAPGSPIELNERMRARRYRWNQIRRSWYKELFEDQLEPELHFLKNSIYQQVACNLSVDRIKALDRFSVRGQP